MADAAHPQERPRPDGLGAAPLDSLNLEQALTDLELAHARVVDLTGRVTSLSEEVLHLRAEVGNLQLALAQEHAEADRQRSETTAAQAELRAHQASRAYAFTRRVSSVVNRLTRR
ncbi:hypothetical protein [Cellulomonas endometrii]|uniref:hypothetical protein n=1 Tax=Cellulomonas endometrii TaxID=3036301 RepID=UPI0024AE121A|nr:hypothetical protein [Cellulomonas endometrii]